MVVVPCSALYRFINRAMYYSLIIVLRASLFLTLYVYLTPLKSLQKNPAFMHHPFFLRLTIAGHLVEYVLGQDQ